GKPVCIVARRLHGGAGARYHHCPAVGTGRYKLPVFHADFPIMKVASVLLGKSVIEQHRKTDGLFHIGTSVREWWRGHDNSSRKSLSCLEGWRALGDHRVKQFSPGRFLQRVQDGVAGVSKATGE